MCVGPNKICFYKDQEQPGTIHKRVVHNECKVLICVEFDKNVWVESYDKRNTLKAILGHLCGGGEHHQINFT